MTKWLMGLTSLFIILTFPLGLRKMREVHVEREIQHGFEEAVKKSDYRFIGIKGFVPSFPNVPRERQGKLLSKYGYRFVGDERGGEYSVDIGYSIFHPTPYKYALGHNRRLLTFLDAKNKKKQL